MHSPYLLMAALYAGLALLAALEASLASFGWAPWFTGLRWLRVHFITLGLLVEVIFGVLPGVLATRAGRARPEARWDIWAALNLGIVALVVGIPIVYAPAIAAGGTLVFVATVLLLKQVWDLRAEQAASLPSPGDSFYLAGLGFLLVGVLAGTGLWLGWGEWLRMAAPKEVHLHANLWGFTSLTFAGLLIDTYPHFAGRPLAWPRSTRLIFWALLAGGLALVAAPWLGLTPLIAVGILLHHLATLWLLASLVRPLLGQRARWTAGLWHIVLGYALILVPIFVAPVIVLTGAMPPMAILESGAPSVLVYGWALQLSYALFPYLLARLWPGAGPARLGGNWLSLLAVNLGALALAGSMAFETMAAVLTGAGYALWAASLAPILYGLAGAARTRAA